MGITAIRTFPEDSLSPHTSAVTLPSHTISDLPGPTTRPPDSSLPPSLACRAQTYDIPDFMSQMSVRDVDIVPDFGINAYNNLTAAKLGEKQGEGGRGGTSGGRQ